MNHPRIAYPQLSRPAPLALPAAHKNRPCVTANRYLLRRRSGLPPQLRGCAALGQRHPPLQFPPPPHGIAPSWTVGSRAPPRPGAVERALFQAGAQLPCSFTVLCSLGQCCHTGAWRMPGGMGPGGRHGPPLPARHPRGEVRRRPDPLRFRRCGRDKWCLQALNEAITAAERLRAGPPSGKVSPPAGPALSLPPLLAPLPPPPPPTCPEQHHGWAAAGREPEAGLPNSGSAVAEANEARPRSGRLPSDGLQAAARAALPPGEQGGCRRPRTHAAAARTHGPAPPRP